MILSHAPAWLPAHMSAHTCLQRSSCTFMSCCLKGRSGKQCRERWHNQLDPSIKKEQWTEEEDRILLQVQCFVPITRCRPPPSSSAYTCVHTVAAVAYLHKHHLHQNVCARGAGPPHDREQVGRDFQAAPRSHRQCHQKPLEFDDAAQNAGRGQSRRRLSGN